MKQLYTGAALLAAMLLAGTADAQSKQAPAKKVATAARSVRAISPVQASAGVVRGGGPANDECTGSVNQNLASGSSVTFEGDNTGATDNGEGLETPAVWEQFTLTAECSDLTLSYCGTDPAFGNAFLSIFIDCPFTDFIEADDFDTETCSDGNVTIYYSDVPAGTYYYAVMLDEVNGAVGPYTITVSAVDCPPPPPPPANDECADAIALTAGEECVNTSATLAGATQTMDPATCSDFTAEEANDVWFSFVAGEGSNAVVVTAEEDVVLEVLEGSCGSLSTIACVDAGSTGEQLSLLDLTEGTTYYVRVYAWAGEADVPEFDICVVVTPPSTDVYCSAGADGTGLGLEERIVNVNFAGIDNDSPDATPLAPSYSDFIDVMGMAEAGASYPIAVDVNRNNATTSYNENQVLVWIDFNQNDDLTDAGELVFTSEIGSVEVFEGSVAIPMDAMLGETRMRIRLHDTHDGSGYENNFNDTPCGLASYGEVEDYTVTITEFSSVNDMNGAGAFTIFPNPTNGDITINGGRISGNVMFEITDMTGRVVYSHNVLMGNGQLVTLPIAGKIAAGMYNLSLVNNGARSVRSVVVR